MAVPDIGSRARNDGLRLGVTWHWKSSIRKESDDTTLGSDAAYHVDWGLYLRNLASQRASRLPQA